MSHFFTYFLVLSFVIGCSTENPLCTDNYCVTGEIFEKSELTEGQDHGTLPLDEAALLAALENPPVDMIAKNVPSYIDWADTDRGSEEEKALYKQVTRLRQGLILPPNTIAVSEDLKYLVGHRPDDGKVTIHYLSEDFTATSRTNLLVRDDFPITLVKHGPNWVVERYTPVEEPVNEANAVPSDEESNFCRVGDKLQPGDSCLDGTGDPFKVLENGSGRYLFITAGKGINLFGNVNGKVRNFSAEKLEDGTWEIKSVTPNSEEE